MEEAGPGGAAEPWGRGELKKVKRQLLSSVILFLKHYQLILLPTNFHLKFRE